MTESAGDTGVQAATDLSDAASGAPGTSSPTGTSDLTNEVLGTANEGAGTSADAIGTLGATVADTGHDRVGALESVPSPIESVTDTGGVAVDALAGEAATTTGGGIESATDQVPSLPSTVEATAQQRESLIADAGTPVASTAGPTPEAVAETASGTVETVAQTAVAADEPIIAALDRTSGTVAGAAEPVADTVVPALTPVADTASGSAESVAQTVEAAGEPIALDPTGGAVAESVVQAAERVAESTSAATVAVTEITGPVPAGTIDAAQAAAPTSEAVTPVSTGVEAVAGPADAATGVTGAASDPLMVLPPPFLPTFTPEYTAAPPLVEPIARTEAVIVDPLVFGEHPVLEPAQPAQLPVWNDATSDAWFGLADLSVDITALQTAGAVGAAVGGGILIARAACSPATTMLFTNVRLLPCVAGAAVQHSAAVAASTVSDLGQRSGSGAKRVLPSFGVPLHDGFQGAIGRLGDVRRPDIDMYEGSRRLLARIVLVLGAIYAALLTLWFALTRARWNGDSR